MQDFNRQKLMENINELIQQKGLKIGEVETAIGVSVGYISRLTKKGTDNAPATDIIWKLAKYLGVSTDMLIEGDFSKATDNLQYMRNFFVRLRTMTDANEIEWNAITVADVNEALCNEDEVEEPFPIIAKRNGEHTGEKLEKKTDSAQYSDYSFPEYGNKRIKSAATGERVWTCGSGFQAYLGNNTTIYIFKMAGNFKLNDEGCYDVLEFYDIYFGKYELRNDFDGRYQPDDNDYVKKFLPVCNTLNNAVDIESDIALLFKSIARHEWDLKISEEVRSAIDEFLNPLDTLPF